jgi:hypothetical protein
MSRTRIPDRDHLAHLFPTIEWEAAQHSDQRRAWRWIRQQHPLAQAVLITGMVTVGYLLFVFGLLLGVGLGGLVGAP